MKTVGDQPDCQKFYHFENQKEKITIILINDNRTRDRQGTFYSTKQTQKHF